MYTWLDMLPLEGNAIFWELVDRTFALIPRG